MIFQEMQEYAADRCGVATLDPSYSKFAQFVNAGLRAVETANPNGWPWMRRTGELALIPGQEEYGFAYLQSAMALETRPAKIVEVRLAVPSPAAQMQPIKRLSRHDADTKYPETQRQIPQVWWVEGQQIGFRPVTDGAYTARITVIVTEKKLVLNDDEPLLPARFHDVVVEKACEMWFRRVHNAPDAQVAAAAFGAGLTMIRQSAREYTGAGRVRVESDDWG